MTIYRDDDRGVREVFDPARYENPAAVATCGACGRSWDDSISTAWTPVPSARCPFEYEHEEPDGLPEAFTLHIELGNDSMQTPADIAQALVNIAQNVAFAADWTDGGSIRDSYGNTVGSWQAR